MEQDRSLTQNGQELGAADFNVATQLSSRAQDYILAELFRLAPVGVAGSTVKAVLPFGFFGGSGGTPTNNAGIVQSTNSTNPSLLIYPFRAIIGPRRDVPTVSPKEWWREARSVLVASNAAGDPRAIGVNLPSTASNNRCDLIYCKITLGAVTQSETRYVRDPDSGVLDHITFDIQTDDTYQIGRVPGTESATPARPALPADTATEFYIPLAFCYLVHPSSGGVSPALIHEVAPVITLSRATGGASLQPAGQQNDPLLSAISTTPFVVSGSPHRPDVYMAPSMTGQEGRLVYCAWQGTPKSPPIGGTVLVDQSIDWRNRVFRWFAKARNDSGARPAWSGGGAPARVPSAVFGSSAFAGEQNWGMGQSFLDDCTAIAGFAGGAVAVLQSTIIAALANPVLFFVDLATGNLMVNVAADPGVELFFWLEASGPMQQAAGGTP